MYQMNLKGSICWFQLFDSTENKILSRKSKGYVIDNYFFINAYIHNASSSVTLHRPISCERLQNHVQHSSVSIIIVLLFLPYPQQQKKLKHKQHRNLCGMSEGISVSPAWWCEQWLQGLLKKILSTLQWCSYDPSCGRSRFLRRLRPHTPEMC